MAKQKKTKRKQIKEPVSLLKPYSKEQQLGKRAN
jgi:hypothetical protein